MCLSNVYENSVEQKNLILSNVQRYRLQGRLCCASTICLSTKRALRARLATIDLVGNTAVIVKD